MRAGGVLSRQTEVTSSTLRFNTGWMVGAAEVTNGVRERKGSSGERADGRETEVVVSVIETSKGSSLEDLGRGFGRWKRRHICLEWLIEERGKSFRRRTKGGEWEARKCRAAEGRLFDSIHGGNDPNYPAFNVPSMRHLAKLEVKTTCDNKFVLIFENTKNLFGCLKNPFIISVVCGLIINRSPHFSFFCIGCSKKY